MASRVERVVCWVDRMVAITATAKVRISLRWSVMVPGCNAVGATTVIDLTTTATPTHGTAARKSVTGAFPTQALWAGDVTFDGMIKYTGAGNDRDPILQAIGGVLATNTVTGYLPSDVNMDGTVKYTGAGNDRDVILVNIGGTVATNVRVEQVP